MLTNMAKEGTGHATPSTSFSPNQQSVILEVNGHLVKCDRKLLTENSDYFKAMLEGHFVESKQNTITLKDVEPQTLETILKILWDFTYIDKLIIAEIFAVMQTASMLMFTAVQVMCAKKVVEHLNIENCLITWHFAETFGVQSLLIKSKLFALMEFENIRKTGQMMKLSSTELYRYLSNRNLRCNSERNVFEAIFEWYFKSDHCNKGEAGSTENLLKLLHCVDFMAIAHSELEEMISQVSERIKDKAVVTLLKCLLCMKLQRDMSEFDENCRIKAQNLLKSKIRNSQGFPCFLLDNIQSEVIFEYDEFKRKRKKYDPTMYVLFLDPNTFEMSKSHTVKGHLRLTLYGHSVIGHKQFILLLGGEVTLGTGRWHNELVIYDMIKETWSTRHMPFPRRHFQTCISGDILYIVGGIGSYRIIQSNMFYHDMESNTWSSQINLPLSPYQIMCCSFMGTLFLMDPSKNRGYLFNQGDVTWTTLTISGECASDRPYRKCTIVSYKSKLYIRDRDLVEMELVNGELIATSHTVGEHIDCDTSTSVLCGSVLYTVFKKEMSQDVHHMWFEALNLESKEVLHLFEKSTDEVFVEINGQQIALEPSLSVLSCFNPFMIEHADVINTHDCSTN